MAETKAGYWLSVHHVVSALRAREAILDGEIVCMDAQGRPRFYDLMFRRGEPRLALFDILWKEGEDLRDLPLIRRKKILRKAVPAKDSHLLCVDHDYIRAARTSL